MSQETIGWLNTRTLIGFTSKRGNAWHYRLDAQGGESNHYLDAIPVDDVLRRLFNFEVVEQPLDYEWAGVRRTDGRKLMIASDNGDLLGVFKGGYAGHDYKEWLVDNVSTILDDSLAIGSAGLLKNRAQAWVSVEVPETITTPEGVAFRPNLTAATSFDGSISTTYKRMVQVVVCDNTLTAGLNEDGQQYKLRHTKHSGLKISDAREALAVVYATADDFAAEVQRLTQWNVTPAQFEKLLHVEVPVPVLTKGKSTRGVTMATKKQDEIKALYANDPRCAPWTGTAFGVLQAYNTWNHHKATIRGIDPDKGRIIRNMENALGGVQDKADSDVLSKLALVCA